MEKDAVIPSLEQLTKQAEALLRGGSSIVRVVSRNDMRGTSVQFICANGVTITASARSGPSADHDGWCTWTEVVVSNGVESVKIIDK